MNLNISGSTAGVSTGYYPLHWYTYIIGYGPALHVVGGDVLDSPQTLQFGPNQGTSHIDSGYPINPIGAPAFHWLLNMTIRWRIPQMLTGHRQVSFRRGWLNLLVTVLLVIPAMSLAAQTLEIKLVDGRNGRPMVGTSAYVNVWVGGSARKQSRYPRTTMALLAYNSR